MGSAYAAGVDPKMGVKICQLCAVDFTLEKFLLPLIDAQKEEGWEVVGVCSDGPYVRRLQKKGYRVDTLHIARSMNPVSAIRSIIGLYRLFRKSRFDILHAHTPVAALLGRIAAKLAGIPLIIYTAHGFYFHEEMPPAKRWFHIFLERLAGLVTDYTFTQSEEDALSAVKYKIAREEKVLEIGNGVDTAKFNPEGVRGEKIREELNIPKDAFIIGIVGRLVAEKGYREFLSAACDVGKERDNVYFLVVGEKLKSDHAESIDSQIDRAMQQLGDNLKLLGMREDVADVLGAIDIFCLPSYREGMPRTIIEAMMMGKPVIATNIRGAREEVVNGKTGLLVKTRDAIELQEAIQFFLDHPDKMKEMGREGRARALDLYDESKVIQRQISTIKSLLQDYKKTG